MSAIHEAMQTIDGWQAQLNKWRQVLALADSGEALVAEQKKLVAAARATVDELRREQQEREAGLKRFIDHANTMRGQTLDHAESERKERLALIAHAQEKLDALQLEITRTTEQLHTVRTEKQKADEELAKIYRNLDLAAERLGELTGRTGGSRT